MARIPLIDPDDPDLDPEVARAFTERAADAGYVRNVSRALAFHPAALNAVTALRAAGYGPDSSLSPVEAELAYLTTSVVNACHY